MERERKIFFFHNQKAGGTSIVSAIKARYNTLSVCGKIANDPSDHRSLRGRYGRFRGYGFYHGHYGRDVFEAVSDGHVSITNFRHPIARVLSLYNYFRCAWSLDQLRNNGEGKDFEWVSYAQELTFREFVMSDDATINMYIRNAHFRQLSGSPWSLYENETDLKETIDFIDEMPCFYISEFPELSLRFIKNATGLSILKKENVTPISDNGITRTNIDSDTINIIRSKNQLDLAIYNHAVRRLLGAPLPTPTAC
jgi:hypothetical protein